MPGPELRPRLGTEIVDAAFQLYRRHFGELLALNALVFAPFVVIELMLTGGRPADPAAGAAVMSALMIVGWLFGSLAEAAMVVAVSNSYLHGAPDVPRALRRAFTRLGAILFASLAKWLLIALAFALTVMLSLIPLALGVAVAGATAGMVVGVFAVLAGIVLGAAAGLYVFCRYFAVPATVVLEGLGVFAALRRSRELSRDYKRKIALTLALPMVLLTVLQMIIMTTLQLTLAALPLLATLIQQAVTLVISPIISIIAVLLYYDARIVKEGFDIEVLALELGVAGDLAASAPQP